LNLSSPSKLLDSSSDLIPANDFLKEIPAGYDIPYKGMLILIEKHSDCMQSYSAIGRLNLNNDNTD